ncbi:preprotein translocase subunit SecG [Patescibacteria group bacterium]|nr:preprotein translocase subunit SecG [Patescibacteria group bacterium]
MNDYLLIGQSVVSALLITVIIMQNRGAGLGGIFGGEGNAYRTKRGAEKFLMIASIILAVIFMGLGIVNILIF